MQIYLIMTTLILFAACWAIICRVRQMRLGATLTIVFLQHFLLGMGLFVGALVPFFPNQVAPELGSLAIAVGIFSFLLFGTRRWKHGPPPGITNPPPLGESELTHAAGGKK